MDGENPVLDHYTIIFRGQRIGNVWKASFHKVSNIYLCNVYVTHSLCVYCHTTLGCCVQKSFMKGHMTHDEGIA